MGRNSKIEWTDHTFNPWIGCAKVSPGCANCYAAVDSPARISRASGIELWGPNAARKIKAESGWNEPLKWDRKAQERVYEYSLAEREAGKHLATRPRVFCASQADVFEDRPDLIEPRARLFRLIDSTPFLDWLLLTKRPENIGKLWPGHSDDVLSRDSDGDLYQIHIETRTDCYGAEGDCCWGSGWLPEMPYPIPSDRYRQNVWLMTTVESADYLHRIDALKGCGSLAPILGVSVEPLLGPMPTLGEHLDGIGWVIVGGESGPKARPMNPSWARSIRDQCIASGTPYFFKQWGEYEPAGTRGEVCFNPGASVHDLATMHRVGKKAAGRILDGREWNQFPEVNHA